MSLEITLTGQLAAQADGARADATDLPGRQASLVFAYLVAERDRPVPSEELADALWGGTLPPTWRPALRGVVSKVRDFLDQLGLPATGTLTSVAGCYRLTLPTDTAVDVELAAGEADAARSALEAGDLERALAAAGRARAIAGRPLLPGHEGPWVEDRRAALRQVLIDGLELQADVHLAAGNGEAAVGPARDLVALEPFRDSAHERLLRAHAAAGDRGEALRVYDRYRRALAEELGVGPSPELEAAYLELLHAEPLAMAPAAAPPGSPAPAAALVGGPFVGRGPELGRLRSAFTEAAAGQRRTVLVTGEAGIGKTRLGAELAALAADGATVLAGRCDQYPGVPYLPLREALGRHLAAAPAERLRALRGPEAAELARRWPELAWRLPTTPAPPRADPRADRYLLFEAVSWLLEAVAAGGPLLLLVDDLQGADAATLLLLRSLAHAPRPARLLTVLLYRDDEPTTRASLAVALGDLLRAPGAELVSLGGLAAEDVAALAAVTAGRPLTAAEAELAGALQERTRGNPFLVGSLLAAGGVDRAVRDIPESVRWVVGQRLAGLGGAVEYVLGAAAVLGDEFDLAVLGHVVDLGPDSLLSTLDKAVAARLVEERADAPGRYAFHHPLVRDVLYHGLPAGERARAQRRVAASRAAGGAGS
jgi:DNA-binding SARP family transcriptional activator